MQKYIIGGVVLLLLATAVFAQAPVTTPSPAGQVIDPIIQEILGLAKNLIQQVKEGNGLAALGALVTLLMGIMKTPWGQMAIAKIVSASGQWEMNKQQKLMAAFVFACIVGYFTVPGDSFWKIIGRSVNIALCAIGIHQVVKNFLYAKKDEDVE